MDTWFARRSADARRLGFAKKNTPGLILLDVGLPDIDGFEVCRQIRKFSDVPVIFLTSRSDEINRVVGLEIDGDDYVVKPFSTRELLARIKAIRRRNHPQSQLSCDSSVGTRYGPIGIEAELLPKIFDRFFTTENPRTGNRGTGLGLAIAKTIVDQNRGTIHMESAPGRGAEFLVTLPL